MTIRLPLSSPLVDPEVILLLGPLCKLMIGLLIVIKVDSVIERLHEMVRSWDDIRAEIEACAISLNDAQQLLTGDIPEHQDDLQHEADKLQVQSEFSLLMCGSPAAGFLSH